MELGSTPLEDRRTLSPSPLRLSLRCGGQGGDMSLGTWFFKNNGKSGNSESARPPLSSPSLCVIQRKHLTLSVPQIIRTPTS